MADTARTLTALQALFADNEAGDISAQDLRDFLVSTLGGYGGLYVSAGVTAQTIGTTEAKLEAWNGTFSESGTTCSASTNDVTIGVAGTYDVSFSASCLGTAAETITFQIANNDVAVSGTKSTRLEDSATNVTPCASRSIIVCAAGDVLSVYVSASADASSVTVTQGQFVVARLA